MRRTRAGRCRCLRQLYHQGQHELRPFAATPAPKDMRKSMRTIVLAAVLGIAASHPHLAVAQSAVRHDAPLGQTQPTIIGVQRGWDRQPLPLSRLSFIQMEVSANELVSATANHDVMLGKTHVIEISSI